MGKGLSLADTAFLGGVVAFSPVLPVTPADFLGLYRWYQADSFLGIASDGDSVGGGGNTWGPWENESGFGDDATAAFGPIYKDAVEILPILRFSGSSPAMLFSPGSILGDFTAICACRTDPGGADAFIFYNNVNGHQIRTQFFGSHDLVFYNGGGAPTAFFANHDFEVVVCRRSGGNVTFRQNKTGFAGGSEAGAWEATQIGNGTTGSNMDMGELALYNAALSDADLDQLYDEWFKPRWGLP